jgi:hypothetical protein
MPNSSDVSNSPTSQDGYKFLHAAKGMQFAAANFTLSIAASTSICAARSGAKKEQNFLVLMLSY